MVGTGLRKLGEEWGMTTSSGITYGVKDGYMLTLSEGVGYKRVDISAFVLPQSRERVADFLNQPTHPKEYRLQQATWDEQGISLSFLDNPGTLARMQEFLELVLELLRETGALGADTCVHCHQPLAGRESAVKAVDGVAQCWHVDCTRELYAQAAQESMAYETGEKRYGRGFFGALFGAVAGAVPWALIYSFGWIVGWLGLLIGWLAKKGYELMGGRVGKAKFWIVLGCTLFGVLLGNFAGDAIVLVQALAEEGSSDPSLAYIMEWIRSNLVGDQQYRLGTLMNLGVGVVFSVLGTYGILRDIRAENRAETTSIVDLT